MNCPNCGKEMASGWLRSRGPLQWSTKPPDRLLPIKGQESVFIYTINEPPTAYICQECEKIVVDYRTQTSFT